MLGKNVNNLIIDWNVVDVKVFVKNMIPDEVKVYFNLFGLSMKNRVSSQMSYALIITLDKRKSRKRN